LLYDKTMDRKRPFLVTSIESKSLPVLIIDKKGFVGSKLADKLKEQFLVVLVSGREIAFHKNIIHIPYRNRIPVIPDNTYSHIFVFYSGEKEIVEMLPALLRKANSSLGKVFFLTSLHSSNPELFKRLSHHAYHSLNVLLYGEVFDNDLSMGNMVNLFIHQVRRNKRIEIPNEGLGKLYPIYLDDLLVAVIATAFSHEIKRGNIFIFPRVPFTEMSVARVFQKIDPEIKIDFSRKKIRSFHYFIPEDGRYVFNNYSLLEPLRKIQLSENINHNISEKSIRPPARRRISKNRYIVYAVLAVLLLPLLFVILTAGVGTLLLSQSVNSAEKGKFDHAVVYADLGRNSFATAEAIGRGYVPGEVIASSVKEDVVQDLSTGREAAEIAQTLFSSLNAFSNIYKNPNNDTESEFVKTLASAKSSLLKLEEMKAQGQLPKVIEEKLKKTDYLFSIFENTIDYIPMVLGFDGQKKYLLLFQNNMELRPGGGFIGSYGIVDINKGRVGEIEINDVYDADGKLNTHVEPPFALRRYGGVSHSFLRDSNFSVDYTTNAMASRDLLNRATDEKVDGVIAIDTNFIKNILSVLGTVTVVDYKEEVNADNFYMLTQKHAEEKFFPGSTQKKDFLRALLSGMMTELTTRKDFSYLDLAKAVEKSIKEKHLMVSFTDEGARKTFAVNGVSGALVDNRRAGENLIIDFFATFDANIGANKGNYYLKRQISQNVAILDNGQIQSSATVNFENTSKKDSVFGGVYKNYLRFVLPGGADLRSVEIDGQAVPVINAITNPTEYTAIDFKPPDALEIETYQTNGKEVVGFFIEVPYESSKKVTINYALPQNVNVNASEFTYALRIFKQPGTVDDPYALSLIYPSKFKPVDMDRELVDLGGKIRYETRLTNDKDIVLKFIKK
jgi:hypothetical protein